MSRDEMFIEMREILGLVPGFFADMPEDSLEFEWSLFKRYVLQEEGAIPPLYRELIGVAAAASRQCWYCSNFHIGLARLLGATDEEIQEANHLSKMGAGWSAYLNGMLYDKDQFMGELNEVGTYMMRKSEENNP